MRGHNDSEIVIEIVVGRKFRFFKKFSNTIFRVFLPLLSDAMDKYLIIFVIAELLGIQRLAD